jgi:hypothetical protein
MSVPPAVIATADVVPEAPARFDRYLSRAIAISRQPRAAAKRTSSR